jgi:hypothetical protein
MDEMRGDRMRCDEIIQLLEKKAPIEYAMDWDHGADYRCAGKGGH